MPMPTHDQLQIVGHAAIVETNYPCQTFGQTSGGASAWQAANKHESSHAARTSGDLSALQYKGHVRLEITFAAFFV